ncbi:hypothetical protein F503_02774 [Ophiostoma piceae UAMH 11346]|uniref:Uncharacterized protein n=1 Tax=Ophiostoma piceae (strain UAMH 11346) TaxID=1262450 RepID=S3CYF1_OPHP1|nr:hypothetical protein F503_02774 [Ophiostoma piceae UAMH 11346]
MSNPGNHSVGAPVHAAPRVGAAPSDNRVKHPRTLRANIKRSRRLVSDRKADIFSVENRIKELQAVVGSLAVALQCADSELAYTTECHPEGCRPPEGQSTTSPVGGYFLGR